ncbi:MAG: 4-hydroxy-tetrahydrodipicolinate reductase [Lachnospiraceae bacterium]|nr:4-hydroxy-tetrahydrodipicolinate reductase [Lachnospiraceae bacterium]
MVRMILHGCNGVMGQVVTHLAAEDPELTVVAGIDINTEQKNDYPVFARPADCEVEADVIVDFSSAKALDALLDYMKERKIPGVLCSTGLSEAQIAAVEEASREVAVLKSANMSLGINTLFKVLKMVAPLLAEEGFDIEIVEKHHNRKLDAPSGTAIALADAINESLDEPYAYKFDRSQERKKREKKEIGFSSVRGGSIVGEHDVIFAGTDEVITIQHTAYSRAIFAKGALAGAKFLAGKPAGYYNMQDVIG